MSTVWALRREELVSDCLVSPDVFLSMVDRLGEFVMPYQQALETEADPHPVHLYLQGLLSNLEHKNAEKIAALVNVERQILQPTFKGSECPWRFFGLRARHTTRCRGRAHHRPTRGCIPESCVTSCPSPPH